MKIHYTNILLFPLKLNILVNTHKKPHTTARHTQKIPTTRSLSECELYAPVNYYSDPQMKEVMDNFNKQTQQRFHEYDERMKTTRQKCKDRCDKEIQKIILKDKLEKELTEKFATLQTDIQSDAIPTCICEKSLADKVEKGCLRCAQNLGGVAPGWGLLSGFDYVTWSQYISGIAAKAAADAGLKAGVKVGLVNVVKIVRNTLGSAGEVPPMDWEKLIIFGNFSDGVTLHAIFKNLDNMMNGYLDSRKYSQFSMVVQKFAGNFKPITAKYSKEVAEVTKAVADAKTGVLTKAGNATSSLSTGITASIIAIVVIVLIMVIIYLVLRYRRKKKMKKKLQYIKLLEE
ncbi:rifin [Plasmodium falciparum NF54]|uniref:Rifin n=2 Tax=Plasmodium falciparum TaxID=5833 RepID=Q8I3E2_PLAF7|nr:rifin [Plasmodium falciparum 3D7]KAF4330698.1 rifin [Plasmodium falciparum NF54]PKC45040.1 rifin [Plasmodium falciparum NF54]CAD51690.1 rifin [Plasmodium falciparum 3D7]|eukprot:XP_001351880.1 rifin [Plasmodium falciparum 3D7]